MWGRIPYDIDTIDNRAFYAGQPFDFSDDFTTKFDEDDGHPLTYSFTPDPTSYPFLDWIFDGETLQIKTQGGSLPTNDDYGTITITSKCED